MITSNEAKLVKANDEMWKRIQALEKGLQVYSSSTKWQFALARLGQTKLENHVYFWVGDGLPWEPAIDALVHNPIPTQKELIGDDA